VKSAHRLLDLFGVQTITKRFKQGTRSLIAPQAFALCDFEGAIPEDVLPNLARLSVKKGDFLAVVAILDDNYVWAVRPAGTTERCNILKQDILGQQGVIPKNIVEYSAPFTIHYSPKTRILRLSFVYMAFNASGRLLGFDRNLEWLISQLRQQPQQQQPQQSQQQ
jgi:hypothetical protein